MKYHFLANKQYLNTVFYDVIPMSSFYIILDSEWTVAMVLVFSLCLETLIHSKKSQFLTSTSFPSGKVNNWYFFW